MDMARKVTTIINLPQKNVPPVKVRLKPAATLKRKPKTKSQAAPLTPALKANVWGPGETSANPGTKPGVKLMTRIKEVLCERSVMVDPETGERKQNSRFDDVADAFVRRMEAGEFQHMKEYIEREEGRVPAVIGVLNEEQLKLYVETPIDGPDAP